MASQCDGSGAGGVWAGGCRSARVMKMLLVHDLVEIDAGDTYCYDAAACLTQKEREIAAADRIFALLPGDQARELRQIWDEFEARTTPEARYAAALDRLQPVLLNYHTQGRSWRDMTSPCAGDRAQCSYRSRCAAALGIRFGIDR